MEAGRAPHDLRHHFAEAPGAPPGGMQEHDDYVVPDAAAAAPGLKILEAAYRWKRARQEQEGEQVA